MSKWKAFLVRLEQKLSDLDKPIGSHRELLIGEVIAAFAVIVWIAAMVLLP